MSSKTKAEYLIQRDYGTRRKHLWVNCTTMFDYGSAKAYIEDSACRGKYRILRREVTDWEVVK
jgi:hypothetical protein